MERERSSERLWKALPHVLLVYFAARLCFFALAISPAVPPDEVTHFGLVEAFSRALWIPEDGPATWSLGAIRGQPSLYYLVFGKLLRLNVLPIPDLVWLRLANALLAVGTVLYGLRWIDLFGVSAWARVIFLVASTNLLMFSGLSASVSYDNLVNLLAAMSFFHLFRWLQERRPADLLWLLGVLLAGSLTKKTFLPLAAIQVGALLVWHTREGWSEIRPSTAWRPAGPLAIGGVVLVALLGVASAGLYGGNLLRYQRLDPGHGQVLGENALRNRVVARDKILTDYREGRISFEQAQKLAARIPHAADRRSTRALLRVTRRVGDRRMNLPAYLTSWTRLMLERTFGYWGHRAIRPGRVHTGMAFGVLACAAVLLAVRRARDGPRPGVAFAGLLAGAYAAVLFFAVNQPIYLRTGLPDLAVQGRYLVPMLVPLSGVVAVAWTDRLPDSVRRFAAPAVALFFLLGDLPFFLLRATPAWFTPGWGAG